MNQVLTPQEQLVLELREMYEGCGYTRFPMRRFEEYQLYLENKSFLTSEQVLSFTDASGKLMALKPDVTLSIVKRARPERDAAEKLYYNESVYRISSTDHVFREIQQIGVEYLGDVDWYGECEVLCLAVESLARVGAPYVLDISHMGLVGELLEGAGLNAAAREAVFALLRQKNAHELARALEAYQVAPFYAQRLLALTALSGPVDDVLPKAAEIAVGAEMKQAVGEISRVTEAFRRLGLGENLRLDFSIANDLDYYNGLVFQGYVQGAPRAVLSGGRYDGLMRKLGKQGDGLGFALYLDELTRIVTAPKEYDADVLALYQPGDDPVKVMTAAQALRAKGLRVLARAGSAPGVRARRTLRFTGDGFEEAKEEC